jgi:hypothetical protein
LPETAASHASASCVRRFFLPKSSDAAEPDPYMQGMATSIDTIIDRWRGATMIKQNALDGSADFESLARDEFSSLSVTPQ